MGRFTFAVIIVPALVVAGARLSVPWADRDAAEAARIQPDYGGPPPASVPDAATVGYRTTTGVAVGANLVTFGLNVAHTGVSRPLTGALGIVTGIVGVAAGAPNLDESGSRRTLGVVNAGVRAASALVAVDRRAHGPV